MKQDLKKFSSFKNDKEAENFVEKADLSEYDLTVFRPMELEFKKKETSLNIRVPEILLERVKKRAKQRGIPYSRYVRMILEKEVAGYNSLPSDK